MAQTGTLRTWNDDRGFGFIAPLGGGRELFVHISAFPRDGSRPTVGETLSYELGRGKDGKPAATQVFRKALGPPSSYPRTRPRAHEGRRTPFVALLLLLIVALALGGYAYRKYRQRVQAIVPVDASDVTAAPSRISPTPARFQCDGRTHCSQMTSCAEATFFLRNCPNPQMDGNHDGVPCEQQWCTSPFAK